MTTVPDCGCWERTKIVQLLPCWLEIAELASCNYITQMELMTLPLHPLCRAMQFIVGVQPAHTFFSTAAFSHFPC